MFKFEQTLRLCNQKSLGDGVYNKIIDYILFSTKDSLEIERFIFGRDLEAVVGAFEGVTQSCFKQSLPLCISQGRDEAVMASLSINRRMRCAYCGSSFGDKCTLCHYCCDFRRLQSQSLPNLVYAYHGAQGACKICDQMYDNLNVSNEAEVIYSHSCSDWDEYTWERGIVLYSGHIDQDRDDVY